LTAASWFPRPDVKGRLGILKVHTKKDAAGIQRGSRCGGARNARFLGADLENLVNEAALLAAREDKDQLDRHDFEMAKDKVLMGPERRSMIHQRPGQAHHRVPRGGARPGGAR